MENAFLFKKKYVKCDVIHLSWSKKEKKKKKKSPAQGTDPFIGNTTQLTW